VTNTEMHSPTLTRSVPLIAGAVLLLAGGFQLTPWKARQLCLCRGEANCESTPCPDARTALRYGLRLGMHCLLCCLGLMMVLLAVGVMNLGAMIVITAAITVERLSPSPTLVARTLGVVMITGGVFVIALSASHASIF